MKPVLNTIDITKLRQTKTQLAQKLGISRGMLYYKHKKPIEDEKLKAEIEIVISHHPAYGYKRIAMELSLNKKRIIRIMKKFVKPFDLGKTDAQFKNEIKGLCPIRPNIVWAGDFTHIRFQDTWVYLATVMDIYTRRIVGWYLSTNHTKDLVIEAFLDAVDKRKIAPVYFHSDQRNDYELDKYFKLAQRSKVIISMDTSHSWENGYQESFYSGFKLHLGPTNHYKKLGVLIEVIAKTLYYYNHTRIHAKPKTSTVKFSLGREYLFKEMGT